MPYTIKPKERCAKAYGPNMRISTKNAMTICRVMRGKKLVRVKRLLSDLKNGERSLSGRYYTSAVTAMADLLHSCEKNADSLGLDKERLIVHASAHMGTIMRRRRRKAGFGSRMKSTNLEIILLEKTKKEKKSVEKKEQRKVDE